MIIKCKCNHCETNLEFEAGNEGEVIQCPSCGMDTTLYKPQIPVQLPPVTKLLPISKPPLDRAKQYLAEVRQDTCYGTLRGLIDVVFAICMGVAGLLALGTIVGAGMTIKNENFSSVYTAIVALFSCALIALAVVIVIATKQAALLLVDIADCQVHLYKKAR